LLTRETNSLPTDAADAADHEGAAHAIAAGLVKGHSAARPGYWLHTGGNGILSYFDTVEDRLGLPSERIFDDLDSVGVVTSLPDDAFHRNVDKIVLACGTEHADVVRTAIVCPPTIYGMYFFFPFLFFLPFCVVS
jgi:hypothetical protein